MRLLKSQNTNQRSIRGKGVRYEINDVINLDSSNVMLVPKGNDNKRPDLNKSKDGFVRYNTDSHEFEFFSDSEWRKVRYKEPVSIVSQSLGTGDSNETVFGPLESQDPDYPTPASAQSVLVFVQNVLQLAEHNYSLLENPVNKPDGVYLNFSSPPDSGMNITVLHNFDK